MEGSGDSSNRLYGNRMPTANDPVGLIKINQRGFEPGRFIFIHLSVGAYNDSITGISPVRGSPIDGNDTAAILRANRIGYESLAIGQFVDLYLLEFMHPGCIQEIAIDGT